MGSTPSVRPDAGRQSQCHTGPLRNRNKTARHRHTAAGASPVRPADVRYRQPHCLRPPHGVCRQARTIPHPRPPRRLRVDRHRRPNRRQVGRGRRAPHRPRDCPAWRQPWKPARPLRDLPVQAAGPAFAHHAPPRTAGSIATPFRRRPPEMDQQARRHRAQIPGQGGGSSHPDAGCRTRRQARVSSLGRSHPQPAQRRRNAGETSTLHRRQPRGMEDCRLLRRSCCKPPGRIRAGMARRCSRSQ